MTYKHILSILIYYEVAHNYSNPFLKLPKNQSLSFGHIILLHFQHLLEYSSQVTEANFIIHLPLISYLAIASDNKRMVWSNMLHTHWPCVCLVKPILVLIKDRDQCDVVTRFHWILHTYVKNTHCISFRISKPEVLLAIKSCCTYAHMIS